MKSTNSCTKKKYHRLLCPLQMNGSGEKSNGGTAENFPSQGFHASLTFNYFISSTALCLDLYQVVLCFRAGG